MTDIEDMEERPTKAEHVAGMVSGTGRNSLTAAAKPIAYRIPVYVCASVDAMAAKAGKSRNAMLNLLVEVGLEAVRGQLDDSVVETLMQEESRTLASLLDEVVESISE